MFTSIFARNPVHVKVLVAHVVLQSIQFGLGKVNYILINTADNYQCESEDIERLKFRSSHMSITSLVNGFDPAAFDISIRFSAQRRHP